MIKKQPYKYDEEAAKTLMALVTGPKYEKYLILAKDIDCEKQKIGFIISKLCAIIADGFKDDEKFKTAEYHADMLNAFREGTNLLDYLIYNKLV